ncbi:MAG: TonB-dependent receptor, partial [Nitrospinota bacterium]
MFVLPTCVNSQPATDSSGFAEESWFYEDSASIGSLSLEPISHIPGVVSVISKEMVSAMGARLLTDVLKQVPGFDLSYNNFGEFFLAIRGIDKPSNVLVLVDGNRFNDFYSGDPLFDIPVDNIDRIEILRGPGSSLYGTNAMVGVVNIITKKELGFNARLGGGKFDTWKANVQFGNFLGDLELFGFFETYNTKGGDALIEEDLAKQQNVPHLTPGRINDEKKKIQGYFGGNFAGYKGTFNLYKEERGPNVGYRKVMARGSSVDTTYLSLALEKTFTIMPGLDFSPRFFADHRQRDINIQLYPPYFMSLDQTRTVFLSGPWQLKKYQTFHYGSELRLIGRTDETSTFNAGVVFENSLLLNTDYKTNYSQ